MFKTFALYGLFGLAVTAASAQGHGAPVDPVTTREREQAPADQAHERRAALRAALLAQREVLPPPGTAPSAEHQLNEKERAELRQQLRQQRRQ